MLKIIIKIQILLLIHMFTLCQRFAKMYSISNLHAFRQLEETRLLGENPMHTQGEYTNQEQKVFIVLILKNIKLAIIKQRNASLVHASFGKLYALTFVFMLLFSFLLHWKVCVSSSTGWELPLTMSYTVYTQTKPKKIWGLLQKHAYKIETHRNNTAVA